MTCFYLPTLHRECFQLNLPWVTSLVKCFPPCSATYAGLPWASWCSKVAQINLLNPHLPFWLHLCLAPCNVVWTAVTPPEVPCWSKRERVLDCDFWSDERKSPEKLWNIQSLLWIVFILCPMGRNLVLHFCQKQYQHSDCWIYGQSLVDLLSVFQNAVWSGELQTSKKSESVT